MITRASTLYYAVLFANHFRSFLTINPKLLKIEPHVPSDVMQKFIARIIQENSHEKDGFLFATSNKVERELPNFAIKKLFENSTLIVLNFEVNRNIKPIMNPNHFQFIVADPGDLSYASVIFKRVKVSRAKIVLILTKKPLPILVDHVLTFYWKIKSVNTIIAYESDGRVEIITYNPYLPTSEKIENLTSSKKDIFYDKTRDLHRTKIRCLITYLDRTKIQKIKTADGIYFSGKDYTAMHTILSHLNGEMQIVTMDYMILNPWFESIDLGNRSGRKLNFLEQKNIDILIKSEPFSVDDVLDNLYPHTQNDLSILVPKSLEIPVAQQLIRIYDLNVWIVHFFVTMAILLCWIAIKKVFGNMVSIQKLAFDILRIGIVNSVIPIPKNYIERILICFWILSSSIFNIYLQTKITSYLAIKTYYPDINTIEELFSSGLPLYAIPFHIEEIEKKFADTEYEPYIQSILTLSSNEGLMDQMNYRADVSQMPSFFTEHDVAVFVARCKNYRKNGIQVYHLVKDSLIPSYQAYKVIHNSPLLTILNKKLRRLGEGGFIKLWAERTIHNATTEGFLYPENYDESENGRPLSLEVMRVAFYTLFLGDVTSFSAFIFELLFYRLNRPKKIPYLN